MRQEAFGFAARRRSRRAPVPEAAILRACLDLLALYGVPAWRNNVGGVVREDARGRRRFIRFGTRGQSDILAILPPSGRLLAIETKSATGRLTADQVLFLQAVRDAGGFGVVIRDVAELEALLQRELRRAA